MDVDQEKCYRAEWDFLTAKTNYPFMNIDDVQRFSKRIFKSKTWSALWKDYIEEDFSRMFSGYPTVNEMAQNNQEYQGQTDGTAVYLNTDTGMNLYTLLHELAHTLGHMHHGQAYRRCLLTLVGRFMGAAHRKELTTQFKKQQLSI